MATLGSQQFDDRTYNNRSESKREKDSLLTHLSSKSKNSGDNSAGKAFNQLSDASDISIDSLQSETRQAQVIQLNDKNDKNDKSERLQSESIDSNDSLLSHDEPNSQSNDCQSPIAAISTMKSNNEIKINEAYAKNFALTPASQATVMPPAAISNAVPKSGCIITKRTGAIKTTIGRNKNFNRLMFSIDIR